MAPCSISPVMMPSVRMARNAGIAPAHEEVEIAALVGLQHTLDIETLIAAARRRLRRGPGLAALAQLLLIDEELEAPSRNVELDHVTVLHQSERAAARGFGRGVEDDGAIGRAAHAGIGYAHHVGNALLQELRRQRHIADLRHAR